MKYLDDILNDIFWKKTSVKVVRVAVIAILAGIAALNTYLSSVGIDIKVDEQILTLAVTGLVAGAIEAVRSYLKHKKNVEFLKHV